MKTRLRKMNKHGDVPVTILVLGVVLICILTIFSFYVSSLKVNKNFDIGPVKEAKLIKEKIDLYENLEFTETEIESFLDIKTEDQDKYIQLEGDGILVRYNLQR